jgi:glutathione synthase/RimK-type ligase-like ATP-grasp enzyme
MAEYIIDRWMPAAILRACNEFGYTHTTFSDDWIVHIESNERSRWVFGYGFDLNPYAAAQNANDKVATYQVLSAAGVAALPHLLIRPQILTDEYVNSLRTELEGNEIIVKPLTGTSGDGITRHGSVDEALEHIRTKERPDWCMSPLVTIRNEKRLFMLDGELLVSYDKTMPVTIDGIIYYNLGKGAHAVISEPSDDELSLARRALSVLGLRVAAVDIITLTDGSQKIIEVNTGITMEHFMRQSEEYKEIGYGVYKKIVARMME